MDRGMDGAQVAREQTAARLSHEPLLAFDFAPRKRLEAATPPADKAASIKEAIARWLDEEL